MEKLTATHGQIARGFLIGFGVLEVAGVLIILCALLGWVGFGLGLVLLGIVNVLLFVAMAALANRRARSDQGEPFIFPPLKS